MRLGHYIYAYLAYLFSLTLLSDGNAADPNAEALRFFELKVRPLLAEECHQCHGPDKQKGRLRLDRHQFVKEGGNSGAIISMETPESSLLLQAVRRIDADLAMPPKKTLSDDQIGILDKWIRMGAPWPDEVHKPAEAEEKDELGFSSKDYDWWAIQPLQDSNIPTHGEGWARNEIDQFVAQKLSENELTPAKAADRYELVRRAYYDLHGLPPTPEQVDDFVNDNEADAWSRLIDSLLASERYGERWAQHWLDVVRYAESDGYRADGYRPEVWRYRDYVIQSLNEDKPYNQFVREQLAGDEIAPEDPDVMIGTAFLRLGIYEWNQRNARMHWDLIMTEMTNATAEAFLGIGIGCAQCHDHKFDPILQRDHFALRAFLSSVWWPEDHLFGDADQLSSYKESEQKWNRATADIHEEIEVLKQGRIKSAIESIVKQFPADVQEIYRKPSEQRDAYEEQLAQLVQRQVDDAIRKIKWDKEFEKRKDDTATRYQKLLEELQKHDDLKPKPLPKGFISTDVKPSPADTYILRRKEKEVVQPAFLTLLKDPAPEIRSTDTSSGRRSALADWIASEDNPLSTRVIVNRVWQHHFSKGLAPSPNDFGALGGTPTHPELLDWLTLRFLEDGWSLKKLHRRIMTSATYRQTARRSPEEKEKIKDPENELLWRYPPLRLTAEQIRDGILLASGELDTTLGGPSQSFDSKRRAIYVKKMRNSPEAFFAGFDAPAGFASAPDRLGTTTPNQSLLLVNHQWPLDRARAFARRILTNAETINKEVIHRAYKSAYGRAPTAVESETMLRYLDTILLEDSFSTATPAPKYPEENGLRDRNQHFKEIEGSFDLGKNSLWLQPGSRFEQLDFSATSVPSDQFTIEAVAILDSIYKDASVNTLLSKWNGTHGSDGWAFGVTSEKSRYQPRNFIMQLVGDNFQGNRVYEVVASDLRLPLRKPVYFAASVSAAPSEEDATTGNVTFFLKDLSQNNSELQKAEVRHRVVGGFSINEGIKSLIGGRNDRGHLWDGQLARLVLHSDALREDELLIHDLTGYSDGPNRVKSPEVRGRRGALLDWKFDSQNGEQPAPGTKWYRRTTEKEGTDSKLILALSDLCHSLLSSNEFLYLH